MSAKVFKTALFELNGYKTIMLLKSHFTKNKYLDLVFKLNYPINKVFMGKGPRLLPSYSIALKSPSQQDSGSCPDLQVVSLKVSLKT